VKKVAIAIAILVGLSAGAATVENCSVHPFVPGDFSVLVGQQIFFQDQSLPDALADIAKLASSGLCAPVIPGTCSLAAWPRPGNFLVYVDNEVFFQDLSLDEATGLVKKLQANHICK
jgi:hypothetical protein